MGGPVTSALARRDRLWPAVALSLAAHAAFLGWAAARKPPPPIDLEQKPIVAKLVRLGEKRPEEFLPRKEAPPPPPAPPPPAAAPVGAPAPKPAVATPAAKPAPPQPARPQRTLASVLSKVQREVEESRWGSPDGDVLGDAESGAEGDRYLALVLRELQANYVLPATMSRSDALSLRASVVLAIDASGRLLGHRFERRSGSAAYDAAVERAIQASRLPPPPPELREKIQRGVVVNFSVS
jgi:colicin import membrane protein/protein TonB